MTNKKVITVTLPNAMGGVASFNRNILKYFDRSLVFIRVILIAVKDIKRVEIQEGFNCDQLIHFTYSSYDNFYYVLKRLGLLIGKDSNFVLTDNAITLNALTLTSSRSIVHYLNHDFFYVKQVLNHSYQIDYCLAHSQFFNDCLASADYNFFEKKLIHLPYGVYIPEDFKKLRNERLKLVFLGRLDYSKGVLSLIDIENELKNSQIEVDWLFIGDGPLKEQVYNQWERKENVSFRQPATTEGVYELLKNQDILVFPSLFEGTPVAIFEALACGCVPIVYDIPGGIREFLKDNFSVKVKVKDTQAIFKTISTLQMDREMLVQMQNAALNYSIHHLDQDKLNSKYFDFIFQSRSQNRNHLRSVLKLGFLDNKIIPNFASHFLKMSLFILKKSFKNYI
jgi:glycosyltransferase involved in cell wall biosynthesis